MTMTSSTTTGAMPRNAINPLVIAGIIAILIGLFLLAQVSRSVTINRSATGFDGLPLWLAQNGVEARTFYGRAVLDSETVGLRILPLFDVDLNQSMDVTNADEAVMAETDRDIRSYIVWGKTDTLPTLIVMPKWRSGVREVDALHPELLIAHSSANRLTAQLGSTIGRLLRDAETAEMTGTMPSGDTYLLHYPQTLQNSSCVPIIGTTEALLLGRCKLNRREFWVLSDPDLLNNHGLSQGDNAAAALDWLPDLAADEGEIVVDVSTSIWTYQRGPEQQRSWNDLARFFAYPFSVIWWSFGCLAGLIFWRAWRRYGAADPRSDEEEGLQASRLVSMDTKARLLRLTGRDGALVRTYIDGRLDTLADEILGPQRGRGDKGRDHLIAAIARRSPHLAEEYAPYPAQTYDAGTAPETLLRHVAQLDDLIERTLDEFGRTRRAG